MLPPFVKINYRVQSEEYSGSGRSYRPSWFTGSMGTMYKRVGHFYQIYLNTNFINFRICFIFDEQKSFENKGIRLLVVQWIDNFFLQKYPILGHIF